jgi:hypothetical protein
MEHERKLPRIMNMMPCMRTSTGTGTEGEEAFMTLEYKMETS